MLTTIGVPLLVAASSAEAMRSDLSMAVSRTASDLILHAAQGAYSVGMDDVLRVCAGVMVAGAVLIGTFMPAGAGAPTQQRSTREGALAALALNPSGLAVAEETAEARTPFPMAAARGIPGVTIQPTGGIT